MKVRILGDIHGNTEKLLSLLNDDLPIIQIGDCGFANEYYIIRTHPKASTPNLMVVGGNHDEYPVLSEMPFYLGDFGLIPGTEETFFCRGAWSMDYASRIPGISWWREEELDFHKGNEMLDLYEQIKPSIMITHECPNEAKSYLLPDKIFISTFTGNLLSECLKIHKPKKWIFGHYHTSSSFRIDDVSYRCLGEYELANMDIF